MVKTVAERKVGIKNAIEVNATEIKAHLGELVRQSVEETLNGLLDAEAQKLCRAKRYVRTDARQDTLAGHYPRHSKSPLGTVLPSHNQPPSSHMQV